MNGDKKQELNRLHQELAEIESKRKQISLKISEIEANLFRPGNANQNKHNISSFSPVGDKIKLFRSLFRSREDVYPRRYESVKTGKSGYQPACNNEWVKGICCKPNIKCSNCNSREYLPLTDQTIEWHLRGENPEEYVGKDFTIGVYPMLPDEKCWFLAVDFDKSNWQDDIRAFAKTCTELNIPISIERSRSGNGGHVWMFFDELTACMKARAIGSYILTETMESRPELGFDSYDRFFPNQDTMPQGGFGNLIALPLQKKPREIGNSVFLDENFDPYSDQWQYLGTIRKIDLDKVESLFKDACDKGRITGLRLPIIEDDDKPWETPPQVGRKTRLPGRSLLLSKSYWQIRFLFQKVGYRLHCETH